MKIFVVSDTHGKIDEFIEKVKSMEKPDLIIHLGDYVEDGLKIESVLEVETIIVKGNGDYYRGDYNEDEIITIGDKKVFITHGHNYGVRYTMDRLVYKAQEANANLVLFGHTHKSIFTEKDGIMIMNPGSTSMPRGFDWKKTFGIIEIGEDIFGSIVQINK